MSTWKCITLATVDYRGSIVVSERSETALPLNILAVFFLWILVKQSIQADQQIFSTCAKHLASKNGGPPWVLFYAHSPWLPFHQLPRGLLRSRILFYHACLLLDNNNVHVSRSELPRLPRKTVDRRTDTHTHTVINSMGITSTTRYKTAKLACSSSVRSKSEKRKKWRIEKTKEMKQRTCLLSVYRLYTRSNIT